MSDDSNQAPAGAKESAAEAERLAQGIARFAKYTSPAMLAMLASAGHNMAFAVGSPPPP